MKIDLNVVVFICCAILITTIIGWFVVDEWRKSTNPCVLEYPLEVTSGIVSQSPGGLFGTGVAIYDVYYKGKRKSTGDVCEKSVRLTEREYERLMYGYE